MSREVDELLASITRDSEIHCPHCDAHYEDDEYQHVSYHGEESKAEVSCGDCGKDFWLEEHVSRTYTTAATRAGLSE
jgi:DNA-directed RNA polymerase subunit RPC12/RpoP